jgi:hypothetical protein
MAKATPAAADKLLCLLCDFGWPSGGFALFDAAKAVTIGRLWPAGWRPE